MATPVVPTDGVDAFEAAVLNKYLNVGDADHPGAKLYYGRVQYDGAAWTVSGAADAAGLTVEDLAWSEDDDQLEITLTGFSAPPIVLASAPASDSAYTPRAHAEAADSVVVAFFDADGVRQDTEGTAMDCGLLIIGI